MSVGIVAVIVIVLVIVFVLAKCKKRDEDSLLNDQEKLLNYNQTNNLLKVNKVIESINLI